LGKLPVKEHKLLIVFYASSNISSVPQLGTPLNL